MDKQEQKRLITEIMNDDAKDGLHKQQTAVEWYYEQTVVFGRTNYAELLEQAKQMEKEQMIEFAEFVATHSDKNKNYLGEMLHAKSKYDSAERTIDLLEQYYNETYGQ